MIEDFDKVRVLSPTLPQNQRESQAEPSPGRETEEAIEQLKELQMKTDIEPEAGLETRAGRRDECETLCN